APPAAPPRSGTRSTTRWPRWELVSPTSPSPRHASSRRSGGAHSAPLGGEVRFPHELLTQGRPHGRGAGRFDRALSAGGGSARLRQRTGAALRAAQAGARLHVAGPVREERLARRSSRQGRDAVLLGHVVTDLSGGVASRPEALPGISQQGL